MTLHSMYKRDDSRTVYRILAEQAVIFLDHPRPGTDSKILFTNLARLLERYRYDAFSDDMSPGILDVLRTERDAKRTDYGVAGRKPSLDVIPALETAHHRVYDALSKEALVQILQSLLSKVATSTVLPDDADTRQNLANARQFFVTLSEELKEHRA
jgi:hypothetical protein